MESTQNYINTITESLLSRLSSEATKEHNLSILIEIKKIRELSYIKEEHNHVVDTLITYEKAALKDILDSVDRHESEVYVTALTTATVIQSILNTYSRRFF
jgi:hypothetical protein